MSVRPVTIRDATLFFDKAPAALMVVDLSTTRVVAANEKTTLYLGYSEDRLLRLSLSELVPAAELKRLIDAFPAQVHAIEIENSRIMRAGGDVRDVDFSLSRLPSGSVIVIGIQDSSARGRLEEQLRQSQKMEALGMLAGGIAHDFNNLLTIISGYSRMLQAGNLTSELDRTALSEVLKACDHAAGLTSQLLAFSRRQPIQAQAIDINSFLEQSAAMLRRLLGERVELTIKPGSGAGCIYADPGQIRQVLLNLVINARDAMPNGGSLVIRTGRVAPGGDVKAGSQVTLEVSDSGGGIDEDTRKHLFEPFFTTKPPGQGTGLGLATVSRIVKQFGGTVDVVSERGKGSTFRVTLPHAAGNPTEEQEAPAVEVRGGSETILLVEDDEGVRSMTQAALKRSGYNVISAANGAEALAAEAHYDRAIALLISDMVMPDMTGVELAGMMRGLRTGLAVLYISGYPGNAATDEDAFLQKPFTPAALMARVRAVLDRPMDVATASPR